MAYGKEAAIRESSTGRGSDPEAGRTLVVECDGHPAIKASHGKTFEMVSEDDVTSSGTCIIGVGADYDESAALALRGRVRITLTCGGESDLVEARINPLFRRGDPLIVRRNPVPQGRSFCIGATKGASGLDRALVAALRRPGARLTVRFEASGAELGEEGALYVVGTPIGNPDDLSMRALDVLASVDLVLAEDTRTTRALLSRHGVRATLLSYHDHNEQARAPEVMGRLRRGERIALVSEAGMPMISDPGYRIVSAAGAADARIAISCIPGPDAVTTALCVAGVPAQGFRFIGFLPRKASDARRRLEEALAARAGAVVFFDTVQRFGTTLDALDALAPERQIAVCCDLTKGSERILKGVPAGVAGELRESPLRGELTIVVAPPDEAEAETAGPLSGEMIALLQGLTEQDVPTKAIASALARASGMSRRDAFNQVVALKRVDDG